MNRIDMRDVVVRWIIIFILMVTLIAIVRRVMREIHAHADAPAVVGKDCDPRDDFCAEGCP